MLQRACEEQGIAWSTATAREATAAQARACGLGVAPDDALPTLIDIDTAEVLRRVVLEVCKVAGPLAWAGMFAQSCYDTRLWGHGRSRPLLDTWVLGVRRTCRAG